MSIIVGTVKISSQLPSVQVQAIRRCSHFMTHETGRADGNSYNHDRDTVMVFFRGLDKQEFATHVLERA
ncbi:MAG: hypothetical protein Q8R25_04270 [bacterium]|nr:hypothetical protein [bacterium]